MSHRTMTLRLNPAALRAAETLANAADMTLDDWVSALVSREVGRPNWDGVPVTEPDPRLTALARDLVPLLGSAPDWTDLLRRLRRLGYTLYEAEGGLTLHLWPSGREICPLDALGLTSEQMMVRLGAPFPGDSPAWLRERQRATLARETGEAGGARSARARLTPSAEPCSRELRQSARH